MKFQLLRQRAVLERPCLVIVKNVGKRSPAAAPGKYSGAEMKKEWMVQSSKIAVLLVSIRRRERRYASHNAVLVTEGGQQQRRRGFDGGVAVFFLSSPPTSRGTLRELTI